MVIVSSVKTEQRKVLVVIHPDDLSPEITSSELHGKLLSALMSLDSGVNVPYTELQVGKALPEKLAKSAYTPELLNYMVPCLTIRITVPGGGDAYAHIKPEFIASVKSFADKLFKNPTGLLEDEQVMKALQGRGVQKITLVLVRGIGKGKKDTTKKSFDLEASKPKKLKKIKVA